MRELEKTILQKGLVIDNSILKVDSFLNYQIDIKMLRDIGKYIASHFNNVDKIVTVESSGIAFALMVSMELNDIPVVIAKKYLSKKTKDDLNYFSLVHSFTHNSDSEIYIKSDFLLPNERILIVDDFLANGNAAFGLIDICHQANAKVIGFAAAVEKTFQGGRARLESLGIPVVSAARIEGFSNNKPIFYKGNN